MESDSPISKAKRSLSMAKEEEEQPKHIKKSRDLSERAGERVFHVSNVLPYKNEARRFLVLGYEE